MTMTVHLTPEDLDLISEACAERAKTRDRNLNKLPPGDAWTKESMKIDRLKAFAASFGAYPKAIVIERVPVIPLFTVRDHHGNVVAGLENVERNNANLMMLSPTGQGTSLHGSDPCNFEQMYDVGDAIGCTDKAGVYYRVERTR